MPICQCSRCRQSVGDAADLSVFNQSINQCFNFTSVHTKVISDTHRKKTTEQQTQTNKHKFHTHSFILFCQCSRCIKSVVDDADLSLFNNQSINQYFNFTSVHTKVILDTHRKKKKTTKNTNNQTKKSTLTHSSYSVSVQDADIVFCQCSRCRHSVVDDADQSVFNQSMF